MRVGRVSDLFFLARVSMKVRIGYHPIHTQMAGRIGIVVAQGDSYVRVRLLKTGDNDKSVVCRPNWIKPL